ncbi:hypothetical protein RFI_23330 [Reticulomyxa filosa]|uniref:Uncharacterized protein n=1 Tax=Reticulomyxa filosa TaxID=46433 RepID=X6MK55_RETFI|nr:hypothetical protein RFI_23330 [Reticulomyxa filosa]|eukprot:ETO14041.1 hypothetical protein RFI_23330 [Reticulomyxa filosa]
MLFDMFPTEKRKRYIISSSTKKKKKKKPKNFLKTRRTYKKGRTENCKSSLNPFKSNFYLFEKTKSTADLMALKFIVCRVRIFARNCNMKELCIVNSKLCFEILGTVIFLVKVTFVIANNDNNNEKKIKKERFIPTHEFSNRATKKEKKRTHQVIFAILKVDLANTQILANDGIKFGDPSISFCPTSIPPFFDNAID